MSDSAGTLAPWLAAQRASLLAQRGHAWLLQGPSGLGQYQLGLELVRAWLCETPSASGACGQCSSFYLIYIVQCVVIVILRTKIVTVITIIIVITAIILAPSFLHGVGRIIYII